MSCLHRWFPCRQISVMTIYYFCRRSLLTQSPAECLQNCLATPHESFSSRTAETGSCSLEKVHNSLQTPQIGLESADQSCDMQSVTHQVCLERNLGCENSTNGYSTKMDSRKRKLSFQPAGSISVAKFPLEHISELGHSGEVLQQLHPGSTDIGVNLSCDDDDFYRSLDLDAVEAQATELLKHKSSLAVPSHSDQIKEDHDMDVLCSPSFDLGI